MSFVPDVFRRGFVGSIEHALKHSNITHQLGIIATGGLGDFVLSLALCRALLSQLPSRSFKILFPKEYTSLAERELPPEVLLPISYIGSPHPPFKQLAKGILEHAPQLRSIGFDKLLCLKLYPNDWERWVLSFVGRNQVWGIDIDPVFNQKVFGAQCSLPDPFTNTAKAVLRSGDFKLPYIINAWIELVRRALSLTLTPQDCQPSFTSYFGSKRTQEIAFCPFGGSRLRDYPDELWLEAFSQTKMVHGYPVTIFVSAKDEPRANLLAKELRSRLSGLVSVHSQLSLVDFISRVAGCSAVIGVDSAPIHIAKALGLPFVTLFAGGQFGLFGPYEAPLYQQFIFERTECYYCNWNCSQSTNICMSQIAPRRVAEAIDLALQSHTKGSLTA
jgi:ADP-heptose:LPS heptosyltransferase